MSIIDEWLNSLSNTTKEVVGDVPLIEDNTNNTNIDNDNNTNNTVNMLDPANVDNISLNNMSDMNKNIVYNQSNTATNVSTSANSAVNTNTVSNTANTTSNSVTNTAKDITGKVDMERIKQLYHSSVTKRINDLSLVHPAIQTFYKDLVKHTKALGFKDIPKVGETFRTRARQMYLWSLGRTRRGKKVTWTRNSKHMHGIAIDIIPPKDIYKKNGKRDYTKENKFLKMAWKLGKKYGLYGIPRRSIDPYHFQLDKDKKLI